LKKTYKLVNSRPVARFYYKGSHSHPVKRTVLITDSTEYFITGYEVREGALTRPLSDAPVKSYRRTKIARNKNLRVEKRLYLVNGWEDSTLKRENLYDYLFTGP
jgi:hypothetical protein